MAFFKKTKCGEWIIDILCAVTAGIIVGTAYHFFQNSNGFAAPPSLTREGLDTRSAKCHELPCGTLGLQFNS